MKPRISQTLMALTAALALSCGAAMAQTPGQTAAEAAAGPGSSQAEAQNPVTDQVKSALATVPGVDVDAITVEESDGKVTLSGPVADETAIDQIESAVKNVDGVTDVDVSGLQAGN